MSTPVRPAASAPEPGDSKTPDSALPDTAGPAGGSDEKVSQHGKRAKIVAIVFTALVMAGLVVDGLFRASKPAEPPKEDKPSRVSQDPFVDFETKQRQETLRLEQERKRKAQRAELERQQKDAREKAEREAQAKGNAPVASASASAGQRVAGEFIGLRPFEERSGAPSERPLVPAAPVPPAAGSGRRAPDDEVREAARLEDLKRALAALKSGSMVTASGRKPDEPPAPPPKPDPGDPTARAGQQVSATESTLVQLRQAFDRARTAKPAAVLERVSAVADNVPQFVRDLRGAEAASTIVGQSATARRERGETRRPGDFLIPVGTAMSAITDMEISSDWEGHWRALITRDVYDLSQDYILIPKGTRVLGTALKAKPVNEAINQRMALAAQWLVLPNGARIDLSRSNMLDAAGVGAIPGDVDHHFLAMAGGVAAYGVIGGLGAAAASRAVGGTTQVTTASEAVALAPGYAAAAEIAKGLTDIGRNVASRYLNLVPTVTVKPGTAMVIFLDDEMYMPAWAPIDEFAPALPARAQN